MPKSGSPNNPDQQPDRGGRRDDKPQKTVPRKVPPPFKIQPKKGK
jgi:hypothetical protein